MKEFQSGDIVVSLVGQMTCQGNFSIVPDFIDEVTATGNTYCNGSQEYVTRLTSCGNDFYKQGLNFREATEKEKKDYHAKGAHILKLPTPFIEGDYVVAVKETFTTDQSHVVPKDYIGRVSNLIEKPNVLNSVFWFEGNHTGWFLMDNFRKATEQEIQEKLNSLELLAGLIQGVRESSQEVVL